MSSETSSSEPPLSWKCDQCETVNDANHYDCFECGKEQPYEKVWVCPHCETINPEYLVDCEVCALARPQDWDVPQEKRMPSQVATSRESGPLSGKILWSVPGRVPVHSIERREYVEKKLPKSNAVSPLRAITLGGSMLVFVGLVFAGYVALGLGVMLGTYLLNFILSNVGKRRKVPPLTKGMDYALGKFEGLLPIQGHAEPVRSVSYTADGKTLLSIDTDDQVCIWDGETGTQVDSFKPSFKTLSYYSSEGFLLGAAGQVFFILNLNRAVRQKMEFSNVGNPLFAGLHPSLKYAVLLGDYHTLLIWKLSEFQAEAEGSSFRIRRYEEQFSALAFATDQPWVVVGFVDGKVVVWDLDTGKQVRKFHYHTRPVVSIAFDRKGFLASGDTKGNVHYFPVSGRGKVASFRVSEGMGHPVRIKGLAFAGPRDQLVIGDETGRIQIIDPGKGKTVKQYQGCLIALNSLAVSPQRNRIAAGGEPNDLCIWEV